MKLLICSFGSTKYTMPSSLKRAGFLDYGMQLHFVQQLPGPLQLLKEKSFTDGILVDYGKGGRPIGIEITAPQQTSGQALRQVIAELNLPPFADEELAPLSVR